MLATRDRSDCRALTLTVIFLIKLNCEALIGILRFDHGLHLKGCQGLSAIRLVKDVEPITFRLFENAPLCKLNPGSSFVFSGDDNKILQDMQFKVLPLLQDLKTLGFDEGYKLLPGEHPVVRVVSQPLNDFSAKAFE